MDITCSTGDGERWRVARYLAGAVAVRLADEGARVTLALLALDRLTSPAVAGELVAALLLPHVLAAPLVGALLDRSRRPGRLLGAAACLFAAGLGLTAAELGRWPLAVLVSVLAVAGCAGPVLTGGLSSVLPGLVTGAARPRVFGLDSLTYNIAGIAGPALGGAVATAWTAGAATALLAALAAAGGAVLIGVPRPATPSARPAGLAGVRAVLTRGELATVTWCTAAGQLAVGALPILGALVAHRQGTPGAAGFLLTGYAVGGVVGSLSWTLHPASQEHAARVVMRCLVLSAFAFAGAALTHSALVMAGVLVAAGLLGGRQFGALLLVRQQAPADVRGQVFAVGAGLKVTAAAVGAALAGALAGLPTGGLLLLAAGCPLLAGSVGIGMLRRSQAGPEDHRRADGAVVRTVARLPGVLRG